MKLYYIELGETAFTIIARNKDEALKTARGDDPIHKDAPVHEVTEYDLRGIDKPLVVAAVDIDW